jgi:hypothetical protein
MTAVDTAPTVDLPPHDVYAEQAALGAMMTAPDALTDIRAIITGSDFYQPRHQAIYDAITHLADHGQPADPVTVYAELTSRKRLQKNTLDAPYLHTCQAACPTPANGTYYAGIVRGHSITRRLRENTARLGNLAGHDLADDGTRAAALASVADLAQLIQGTETAVTVDPDRFPRLDWATAFTTDYSHPDYLPGRFLETGQQISIVSSGKVGKSLLVLDWIFHAITQRDFLGDHDTYQPINVLYFDAENSQRDIITRLQALGATTAQLDLFTTHVDYRQFPAFSGALNSSPTAARECLAIVNEQPRTLVILDTASRFVDGKENDAEPWLDLYRRIHRPLKADGIASARLDHHGKDTSRSARGSSAKEGDVDHVWELTATKPTLWPNGRSDIERIQTRITMERTRTRSGVGPDRFDIIRTGERHRAGMWLPGRTRHTLAAAELEAPEPEEGTPEWLAAELDRHGVDKTWGSPRVSGWTASHGIKMSNAKIEAAVRIRKTQT